MTIKLTKYFILDIILALSFLGVIFPPFYEYLGNSIVSIFLIGTWFLVSFLLDSKYYTKFKLNDAFPFLLLIFMVVFPYMMGNPMIGNRATSMALLILGPNIYNYYVDHKLSSHLKKILLISGIFALITICITLFALIKDPYISRSIKNSGEYSQILSSKGIGGYELVYFVSAMVVPLLFLTFNAKKKIIKITCGLLYVFALFFSIKSNYFTSFLLAIISSVIMMIIGFFSNNKKNILLRFSLLLVIVLAMFNIDTIFSWLYEILPQRISLVFKNGTNSNILKSVIGEFINDRLPTIIESIKAFSNYPFLGIAGNVQMSLEGGFLSGFGQHSYIFDTFALYGFIIGILNIFAILKPFNTKNKINLITIPMLLYIILVFSLNNATSSIAIVSCFIYPLVRDEYINKSMI